MTWLLRGQGEVTESTRMKEEMKPAVCKCACLCVCFEGGGGVAP